MLKRKRREYRQQRKAQFLRPEPGFSLYEGRTRGKRLKYTYSDDDDADASDATSNRRSTRVATPADSSKPVVTASGRQVRSRLGGAYGEKLLVGQSTNQPTSAIEDHDGSDASGAPTRQYARATRSGGSHQVNGWSESRKHIVGYNELDEMEDEEDAMSSEGEWEGGDDEDVDDHFDDNDENDFISSDEEVNHSPKSLVVKLQYRREPGTNGDATASLHVPNGRPTVSTSNGYHLGVDGDHDLDTIVVQQQPLPRAALPPKEDHDLRQRPISQTEPQPLHQPNTPVASIHPPSVLETKSATRSVPADSVSSASSIEPFTMQQEARTRVPKHADLPTQFSAPPTNTAASSSQYRIDSA
ncbi:MAG: hypothetical protein M1822_002176 [Bathelium mastoideum]|nr:MAG: hypothetical protein M1822_002176 [Bathelium mastoideum]